MKRLIHLSPPQVSRLAPFVLAFLAMLAALTLPLSAELRDRLVLVASVTVAYGTLIHLPILKGHTPIAASPLNSVAHTLMITFGFALLGYAIPMIATTYLISIAAAGIRRGLRSALLAALLASVGYVAALTLARNIHLENTDSALLIGLFFLFALLIGSLSQASQRQVREFENVVTRSREAIMILDAAGNFEYLNPAAIAFGGYSADEMLGHSFFEVIDEADRANARAVWDSLATQAPTDQAFPIRLRRKDGETRHLAATIAVYDPDTPRYLVIARDLTAQERERAAHDRRLRELEAERTVAATISETLDLPRMLTLALEQTVKTLQVDAGAIYLADDQQTTLTLATTHNLSEAFIKPVGQFRFGEGLTGSAAADREVLLVADLDKDPRVLPAPRPDTSIQSQASVPLLAQNRVLGVLNVMDHQVRTFTGDDAALLRAIAASVAVAIDRARLFETLEHRVAERTQELAALNRIAIAVIQSLDLKTVLETALDELTHTLQVPGGWIYLLDSDRNELVLRAEHGGSTAIVDHYKTIRVGQGPIGRIIENRQPLAANLEDIEASAHEQLIAARYRSICVVPLLIEERIVGVIGLTSEQTDRFGEAEVRWLTAVGNTIGGALKNARLFEETKQRADQFKALHDTAHELAMLQDLPVLLQTIVERAVRLLAASGGGMYLYDPARGDLRIEVTTHPSTPVGTRLSMGEG
ncbi:MAG: GAF domain-containing protein, partial [Chloroflexota bacterium]|nr:GAF domain-containing protein [Chloroflexota bacterium]